MSDSKTPARGSWLDAAGGLVIENQARKLESFLEALADNIVTSDEVTAQRERLATLMREIEPRLDDELHARVTELLVELTAYDILQVLYTMHAARPKSKFRG